MKLPGSGTLRNILGISVILLMWPITVINQTSKNHAQLGISGSGKDNPPDNPLIVNIDFTSPDTVCVNTVINITNLTTGGSTYYWSFCSGNTTYTPTGVNIGNPGGLLNIPDYLTLLKQGDSCYSFITCQGNMSLIRYYHGSSFNNNPVSWTNLGSFGLLGDSVQDLRIRKDNGQWIGIINNNNRLVRLNFGNSLANTPTAALLGPYSVLFSAHCLEILNENGTWVGYITCTWGNKLVRVNFGNSLLNPPVFTDLGTLGGVLYMPAAFCMVYENGNWYSINVNQNSTHARLFYGSSLLNDPTGTNLGQVCGPIPLGGIVLIRDCNATTGFQLNYTANTMTSDEIFRLNFPSGITGPITGTTLGNIGNMNRPNQFSEIVRVGDTLFTYVTNRQDFTLTRLKFLPCSNASIGSSTLYNPPPFSYNQTGEYNVQLIVDEGLPTQASLCKNIVVVSSPVMNLGPDRMICQGSTATLDAGSGYSSYLWSTGATTRTITVGATGTYWAVGTKYGCQASDTVVVTVNPLPYVNLGPDTTICSGENYMLDATTPGATAYQWQDGSTSSKYLVTKPGEYWVKVTANQCIVGDTVKFGECLWVLTFPDAFSPNNDGLNDVFRPVGINISSFHMEIYDRWGIFIFSTDDIGQGWNGIYKNRYCTPGIYVYYTTFETPFENGIRKKVQGTFSIVR